MAQDATGTPTSLGIPKYNTAADAPSGKGFNAAMDTIDALLVARGLPGSPDTNEPVYWNGSAWVTNKLTDAHLDMTTILPPGVIMAYGGTAAPGGWVLCDGAAISRTSFANLFSIVGTQFGIGDGSTTFNVPNLKGRTVVGIDAGQAEFDVRGETGGAKTHTLTALESGLRDHNHQHGTGILSMSGGENFFDAAAGNVIKRNQEDVVANSGSLPAQNAHNNLQPYIALHYIIKT